MLEMMYSSLSLQQQMKDGAQFIIINEVNNPVGFASYQQMDKHTIKLHKLYVLPSQQGRGTGRKLVEFIISEIKQDTPVVLQLQVNRHNRARQFYEKMGFAVIKECAFDIGNGYVMDDYIMEKQITK